MKVVSRNYKEVMNQTIRPATKFQANLEMIDRSVDNATVVTSEKTDFSTDVLAKVHECDYITFEENFFKVGSDLRILPSDPDDILKNGFVSEWECNEEGEFDEVPEIVITLNEVRNFEAMTYEFGVVFPSEIQLTCYLGDVVQAEFNIYPDFTYFVDSEHPIPDCDKMVYRFVKMSKPFHRLRVARIVFGYEKKFESKDIVSTTHTMSVDPISSSLPYEKVTFKVINYNKDYNPDNPQGIWEHFKHGQPFSFRYGIAHNTTTEWLESGSLLLSDAPTVDGDTATFEAVDILSTLTNTYDKGVYRTEPLNLYYLATKVLEDAGVTNYLVDEALRRVYTKAPLPLLPHKECLQLIANAGECVLYCNNEGKIVLKKQTLDDSPEDFYLDYSKLFNKPVVKKTSELKSVDVSVHTLTREPTISEICHVESIDVHGTEIVRVEHDMMLDGSASVEIDGGNLISAKHYSYVSLLEIEADGTVDVTISSIKIIDSVAVVTTPVNNRGEICPIDNPLITSYDRAGSIGKWIAAYLSSRNTYEVNFRQDFALDVNDVIRIQSEFEENIPARITKLEYKLPGQQGAISVRRTK